eukprot:CAMPEP_0197663336 /NCGR_PEP_ID=MMETSP1338-20131121/57027_1 /TAXON_ID=43686 ORGANISM="Pelagodinium beii, Strain RCC1491" /NCGR_SAMPLE_ID=MMETSP1338 /ASSEMBLY_ACC=CAM_ASM_000754 /LENGTH=245 /DNA_ID=CAMNT_0043241645 /DNA_START=56 /DNA_END=790 /DNA_ORIENTATION=+
MPFEAVSALRLWICLVLAVGSLSNPLQGAFSDDEEQSLCLLQRKADVNFEATFSGCDPTEGYGMTHLLDEAWGAHGANPWQTSWCNRTKRILNAYGGLMEVLAKDSCPTAWNANPRKLLSFGCSIGIEAEEAKYRYPSADVFGIDIDEDVVEKAKHRTRSDLNITFVSKVEDLEPKSFDLILVNNVLYKYMKPSEFRVFLRRVLDLLEPEKGVLELMIYDRRVQAPCNKGDGQCENFTFDSQVAW